MFSKEQMAEWDAFDAEEKAIEEKLSGSSLARYQKRLKRFEDDGKKFPKVRHGILWMLHNCVIHPMLAFSPTEKVVDLHQLTSKWLNKKDSESLDFFFIPKITNRKAWIKHNLLAHLAIGFVPSQTTFDYHDKTAKEMNVPFWV